MDETMTPARRYSRRDFLRGLPAGIVGALVASMVLRRLLPSVLGRRQVPSLPEGSIFTPARRFRNRT